MAILVIPAAGGGSRFQGWSTPKPFLPYGDGVMIQHVRRMFPAEWKTVFGLRREHESYADATLANFERSFLAYMDGPTSGPAATVALALEQAFLGGFLNDDREQVVVCDSDALLRDGVNPEALEFRHCGAVVAQEGCTNPMMSYVVLSPVGNLLNIVEKPKDTLPSDLGVVGIYVFESVAKFMTAYVLTSQEANGREEFLSHVMNKAGFGLHVDVKTVPPGTLLSAGDPESYLALMSDPAGIKEPYVDPSWRE